jgi:hypothetical protein
VKLTGVNRPSVSPTPVPPPVLLCEVRQLQSLLAELAGLFDLGLPPILEALRSDVELALKRPESLGAAENQLDFIEEVADAVWGEPLPSLVDGGEGAPPGGLEPHRGSQVLAYWEQLDRLSERLCRQADAWHRKRLVSAAQAPLGRQHSPV